MTTSKVTDWAFMVMGVRTAVLMCVFTIVVAVSAWRFITEATP